MAPLHPRDDGYYYDQTRYAFIAFVVAAIIVFITATCYVNFRRAKRGRAPIVSSFLAPPSYGQSQVAYEGHIETGLPTYTADPNPVQDVGYYDINGNFIPAETPPKAQGIPLSDDIPRVHTQTDGVAGIASTDGVPYRRPTGPPPGHPSHTEQETEQETSAETQQEIQPPSSTATAAVPSYPPPPFDDPFTPQHTGTRR